MLAGWDIFPEEPLARSARLRARQSARQERFWIAATKVPHHSKTKSLRRLPLRKSLRRLPLRKNKRRSQITLTRPCLTRI